MSTKSETQTDVGIADLIADAIDAAPVCVGLDPVLDRLPDSIERENPARAIAEFSQRVIESVAGVVGIVKPQSACYERYGSAGVAALEATCRAAREAGLIVLLDVKRGDIGLTASHYAAACASIGAHAVTVNPYMGRSAIEPFLHAGLSAFALVRTSNPDSDEIQSVQADSGTVAERVAKMVADLGSGCLGSRGLSALGAVVGATKADDAARLRECMPKTPFLIPGFGAQGGTAQDILPMLADPSVPGRGVLVTASRSVIYPADATAENWQEKTRESAQRLAGEILDVIRS